MKKLNLLLAFILLFSCNLFAQTQALILGYSQVENVYEDENVKMELVRLDLKITNKTNKTIFIDKKSSFYYVNETSICLYEGIERHTKDGKTILDKEVLPVAPNGKHTIYFTAPVTGKFSASENRNGKESISNILSDTYVSFMGYVETLRFELANNQDQSASKLHLTGDDSFLKANVSLNYTLDPKMESFTTVTIGTWVSDMVMGKYYVQPKDKVIKSNAVNVQGRMFNILHVFANSPFEYDEDDSPLDMYTVVFSKGSFTVHQFNNLEEKDDPKQKGKQKDEMTSNFGEKPKYKNIFIWEGESNNWVQSLTDSYQKFLIEDGEKPKIALKKAKEAAKYAKSTQTLKP